MVLRYAFDVEVPARVLKIGKVVERADIAQYLDVPLGLPEERLGRALSAGAEDMAGKLLGGGDPAVVGVFGAGGVAGAIALEAEPIAEFNFDRCQSDPDVASINRRPPSGLA
jgi:hypothetical protein